jgi:hypothetical protein
MKLHRLSNKLQFTSKHTGYTATLLFIVFLAIYSLTYNGIFRVDDEHILAARAQSLASWGKFDEPQVAGNTRVQTLLAYGEPATQIEPGLSLVGAFLYRLGRTFELGGMQVLLTANIHITAINVAMVFLLVHLQRFSTRTACITALTFGLSSMAWPYAMTFLRDSLVMLMATVVLIGLTVVLSQERRYRLKGYAIIAVGIAGGWLAKNSMLAILPALALGLGYEAWRRAKWKEMVVGGVGVLILLLLTINFLPADGPLARYSWEYYRSLGIHFAQSLEWGTFAWVAGPFLSPSKSIFLFSPILVLLPWSIRASWSRMPGWSLTALSFPFFLAFAQALFYGDRWAGNFGWGLRFMLPALPGLFGVLVFSIEGVLDHRKAWRSFLALSFIGAIIQLSASATDWTVPYAKMQDLGIEVFGSGSSWSIRTLTIPYQLISLLDLEHWTVAWIRSASDYPSAFLLIVMGGTLIAAAFLLRATKKIWVRHTATVIVVFLSVSLPLLFSLVVFRNDPYWEREISSYQAGLRLLNEEISDNDMILVDAYGTPLWKVMMNKWDQPIPWISLPYEILSPDEFMDGEKPSSDLEPDALSYGTYQGGMVWYIGSEVVPDYLIRDELSWLEENYVDCGQWEFTRGVLVEVRKFNPNSCD